jgi:hypothetical protein
MGVAGSDRPARCLGRGRGLRSLSKQEEESCDLSHFAILSLTIATAGTSAQTPTPSGAAPAGSTTDKQSQRRALIKPIPKACMARRARISGRTAKRGVAHRSDRRLHLLSRIAARHSNRGRQHATYDPSADMRVQSRGLLHRLNQRRIILISFRAATGRSKLSKSYGRKLVTA